ncbi:hypothetical protein D3C81_1209930 [compost metagenome]
MFRQPRFDLPIAGFGHSIRVAEVDLNAMNGFDGLIDYLRTLPATEMESPRLASKGNEVYTLLPLYRNGAFGALSREWKERPDMTIIAGTGGKVWALEIEYNAGKIRGDKLKELLHSFPIWCRRMAQDVKGDKLPADARTDVVQSKEGLN